MLVPRYFTSLVVASVLGAVSRSPKASHQRSEAAALERLQKYGPPTDAVLDWLGAAVALALVGGAVELDDIRSSRQAGTRQFRFPNERH